MAEDKLIALILAAGSVVPFVVGALVVRQSLQAPEKGFFYIRGFRIERKDGPTYFKATMYFNLAFGIFFLSIGVVCLGLAIVSAVNADLFDRIIRGEFR
jgi:hypothetical protein